MTILVMLKRRRTHRYLINLFTKSLISEMRELIRDQEYTKALDLVYKEGLLEKEILEDEMPALKADLILSERFASWDATK